MAAKILDPSHPLHTTFRRFIGDKNPTKRQARKFLAKNKWAAKALQSEG